ncbi:unnamed protein product [Bursaphelenchus xylophilus]|uniref:(pine wood nematode) hypothetical protein n=1 Tax=Bursaphelenchus xylophilus TaxID=6326 RepID=A0A1I7SFS7_BURXY|nr:unnamed protein product [Bursaphelenchus xylophilus]CAG9114349.1 unnamed protein product [Bursaphelenchus xylophilus]
MTATSSILENSYLLSDLKDEISCSSNEDQGACRVCGAVANGIHFGIIACRACSAFFRRSVAEERIYKCLHDKKCEISSDIRNSCRSCRFTKCLAVGMKVEKVQHPRDRNRTFIRASPPPKFSPSVPAPAPKILERIREGYRKYVIAHRAVFASMYPELIFTDQNSLVVIPIDEKLKLDMATLPSVYMMFRDSFCPYAILDKNIKFDIIMTFMQRFLQLERAYLTSIFFPDKDDAIAFSHSDYMDFEHMGTLFKNDLNPKESARNFKPYGVRLRKLAKKVKALQMDELEFLGLVGIIISDEVYCRVGCEEALVERTQLYKELYEHCQEKSHTNADIRFGQLVLLIRDGEEMALIFKECIFVGVLMDDIYKATMDKVRELVDIIRG